MSEQEQYQTHADESIDSRDMEALAANAEQDFDMDQVIRHNLYIGWIMGLGVEKEISVHHGGGNRLVIAFASAPSFPGSAAASVSVIVPYPPKEWQP